MADAANSGADILTKRKVYIVPFIQPSPQAPDGFQQRFNAYWQAVDKQLSALEAKAGVIKRIFAEGVLGKGEDALVMLDQTNGQAHLVVKSRVEAGAKFDQYEDEDLFGQVVDWSRCLSIGFVTESVAGAITASYQDAVQRRQRHLDTRLAEGVQAGEAALLLSGSTDPHLPDDVERFIVAPPELDELDRWIRSVNEAIRRQQQEAATRGQRPGQAPPSSGQQQGGNSGGSRLWTPGS